MNEFRNKEEQGAMSQVGFRSGKEHLTMGGDRKSEPERQKELQAQALARETGITRDQALTLIELLGTDRSSLLREANILKNRKPGSAR
ncbi:hypothetical protein [Mesorhizobium sp.]|uniref:hypothetical protein n=1 Tax=Mesorhizobium sp. TaxID=1871066 RepID=UPI0025E67FD9|nr:hypothetical protein [Mesorhizobium sp.]